MDYSYFSGLIQNVALLLVFSFLYATRWINSTYSKKLWPNVFAGIIVGGIGILLMFTPWTYQPGHYFDLRTILLAIAGLYLGAIPTIIAIVITATYRLFLGGNFVLVGVCLIVISGLTGIAWRYFQQKKGGKNSILSLYFFGLIVHIFMLLLPIVLPSEGSVAMVKFMAVPILVIYPVITVLLGVLMNRQLEIWRNRKAKDRLFESEQRFTQMMLDINMVFINLDKDRKIIFCNKYLLDITGYTQEELVGKRSIDIFVPQEEREITEQGLNELFDNNRNLHRFESKILTKNNRELYISWYNSVVFDDYGKIAGIASLGENITEKKATFDSLREAKKKAEESNRLKSVFLQNISHEIRTPLNAIMGAISLLKLPSADQQMREKYYEVLRISGARLLATVNDLIDISQVETQQIKVNKSKFSLSKVLTNHVNVAGPIAEKKANKIICTSKYLQSNTFLYTDRNMLNSIFINLISNANKFTSNGTIEIGSYDEHGDIVFYVKDNGIGIPENRLEVIFDRFVQADSSLSRSHEGSGLGLSIALAYAEMLGGSIWVESEEGKGSTFYFNIPKDEVYLSETDTDQEESDAKLLPDQKILIAEDDKLNYLILKKIVENIGISEILHAVNGAEAVEMVKNNPDISLVLMDIKMPEMSGEEATLKIKEFNQALPIIAQTAFAMPGDRERYLEMGFSDYIPKPIDKNALIKLLQKYLNSSYQDVTGQ
ncbi:response regulator [Salinimicrobium tongyeongense]|uniref:histidine kinase n=1 Tax=Salinimicrobium tongyeongense TaxID=2809707 RepID=A0ABY6NRJ1_9FLAO|nr:LytS/YhcK type 5TM receptor domain-containing protein [Salinimicrobium tongyeongense]UZH55173.1 response regulator [Salinimicrobium tongyeongense]